MQGEEVAGVGEHDQGLEAGDAVLGAVAGAILVPPHLDGKGVDVEHEALATWLGASETPEPDGTEDVLRGARAIRVGEGVLYPGAGGVGRQVALGRERRLTAPVGHRRAESRVEAEGVRVALVAPPLREQEDPRAHQLRHRVRDEGRVAVVGEPGEEGVQSQRARGLPQQ